MQPQACGPGRAELASLCAWLQEFVERERAELARTLHDELGGLLTAAKMDVSWLQSRTAGAMPGERLTQLAAVLDEAMDLKRRLVEELRPSLLVHFGLATALRTHVGALLERAGIGADLELDESCDPMPRDLAIVLFRVVEAALAGTVARARARHVRLTLSCDGGGYELLLAEDAPGASFDAPLDHARALLAVRERLRALGGSLRLDSAAAGTTLSARLPRVQPRP